MYFVHLKITTEALILRWTNFTEYLWVFNQAQQIFATLYNQYLKILNHFLTTKEKIKHKMHQ